jgi:prevent-host-death family protein
MTVLTANDLKTKGVSDIERLLQEASEVVVSVRGKPRYVVMDIAHYDYLRKCEIATTWAQSRSEVEAGCFRREGAEAHRARVERELADAV